MPVTETQSKLWFKTKEAEQEYDDMMMANIELKSQDYENENFTVAFTRSNVETFYEESEIAKRTRPTIDNIQNVDANEHYRRFAQKVSKHNTWVEWPFYKMSFGFAAGYVILRELPLRNFYARALIMGWFLCKYANTMGFPFISRLMPGTVMLEGENKNWVRQLENFPLLNAAVRYQRIPNANNRLTDDLFHDLNRPAHLRRKGRASNFQTNDLIAGVRTVEWDGTTNMPLDHLANPKHRGAKGTHFL